MNLIAPIINIIYPPFCEICCIKLKIEEKYICSSCLKKIRINMPPFCRKCSRHLSNKRDLCWECLSQNFHIEQVWSWGIYRDVLKQYIYHLKYKHKPYLINILKDHLYEFFEQNQIIEYVDILCPIPLYPSKLKERTFNQSEVLANIIHKRYKIDSCEMIRKTRHTIAQNRLNKKQRHENIKGSFTLNRNVLRGKNILLIDDILTTGATLNECARVLLEGGAKKVYGFTLARGL
ncbi:MAG: ComF family protein [Candidatus Omnitrophica bacterium]|nr:ComF family protein [Candidatus Omnitrophota bacterium]